MINYLSKPFRWFFKLEAASGLVLLFAAIVALVVSNSNLAELYFKNNWIDACVRQGKASGAFAHPSVPSLHPYVLVNYQGKIRDVMTLAHELGHGVHQILAAKNGLLMSETPLTLAETASVFGEMLVFRKFLDAQGL